MTDSALLRNRDGSYTLTFTHGQLTFPDGDTAMTYFAELVRRVGAAEREADKVKASR